MSKNWPKTPKFEKKRPKKLNFNIFFLNAFKEIGKTKNPKFINKKLKKYVFFDVNNEKSPLGNFSSLKSSFDKKNQIFFEKRSF